MKNLLKMYAPQLLVHEETGALYIQLTVGGTTVMRPTPAALPRYTEEESRNFFSLIIPQMVAEIKTLRKEKLKKLKRKEKHANQKR
jgi:hypothetical protein